MSFVKGNYNSLFTALLHNNIPEFVGGVQGVWGVVVCLRGGVLVKILNSLLYNRYGNNFLKKTSPNVKEHWPQKCGVHNF